MTTNDYETAECFADAFSSVFTREPLDPLPQCCYDTSKDNILNLEIEISEKEIYNEFKSINIYKSFGPDNIHPKLLHALADNHDFIKRMKILYNKCIEERKIPLLWKTANVVALHKKKSKLDHLNYRPVSLTCILCKVYEKFLRRHVPKIVDGKINKDQHAFIEGKSCFFNLVETIDSTLYLNKVILFTFFTLISGKLLIQFHTTVYLPSLVMF